MELTKEIDPEKKAGLQRLANTITQFGIAYSQQRRLHYHVWQCLQLIPENDRPLELKEITEQAINETRLVLFDKANGTYLEDNIVSRIKEYHENYIKYIRSIDDISVAGYELVFG
jgi:hypothetical protein